MKFPKLTGQALLSPMAGVTDVAFRALCRKYGAALTYTEFVSSLGVIKGNTAALNIVKTDPIETPVAVQLFGSSPEDVVEAAKKLKHFDIIDINCGCPAWKVIKTGAGSELLKDPQKVGKFVENLVKNTKRPITVKIRAGIDDKHINAVEVAQIIEKAGAAAIAIHGRTQKQAYRGLANWDIIKQVKEAVKIPVIGNGDVFTPEDFKEKITHSNVDYIMIARGAIGNPYIFTQINDYMKTGTYNKNPDKIKIFFEYHKLAKKYNLPFATIKQQALSFTKGIPNSAKLRNELAQSKTEEELMTQLNQFI